MIEREKEQKPSKTGIWILVVVIVIGLIIGGYYLLNQETSKELEYTGSIEKIVLAGYAGEAGTLVYIAKEQGSFEKNGLDVEIKDYQSGKAATDALLTGEADISTSADSVLVSNSFDYEDLIVFGTISTFENKELIARKDKGISQPSDLKNKKIGVTKKSGGEFALGFFLIFNSISQQDIEIVDLKPFEMLEAISNGDVDAVFTWDPNVYNIKQELGNNAISWPGQSDFYFVLLTKKDWLENNPAAAERFLKSIIEAEDYIKDNSEAAKEFIKNRFGYESDYIDYSWPKQEFIVTLDQAMLISFEDIARWRIENNLTDKTEIPNYLDYIHVDTLHEIKPEACTIVH